MARSSGNERPGRCASSPTPTAGGRQQASGHACEGKPAFSGWVCGAGDAQASGHAWGARALRRRQEPGGAGRHCRPRAPWGGPVPEARLAGWGNPRCGLAAWRAWRHASLEPERGRGARRGSGTKQVRQGLPCRGVGRRLIGLPLLRPMSTAWAPGRQHTARGHARRRRAKNTAERGAIFPVGKKTERSQHQLPPDRFPTVSSRR